MTWSTQLYDLENRLNKEIEEHRASQTPMQAVRVTPEEHALLRDGGLIRAGVFWADYGVIDVEVEA